jgi:putative NIF3 family GTP cyclohydrolase 1 type 2
MTLSLTALADYLNSYLDSAAIPNDQNGIYRPSQRPIQRIGLAIEPWTGITAWVQQEHLDALFLHRPWKLDMQVLPEEIGILAYHLAFDLKLTFGLNYRLADVLQMTNLTPFAFKDGLPLGMIANITSMPMNTFVEHLGETFGVVPTIERYYRETVDRVALVGAMTDTLIREADKQGVDLYITGQFRQPARRAVDETSMTVAVVGHAVGELWGIRTLASVLRERYAELEVVIGHN